MLIQHPMALSVIGKAVCFSCDNSCRTVDRSFDRILSNYTAAGGFILSRRRAVAVWFFRLIRIIRIIRSVRSVRFVCFSRLARFTRFFCFTRLACFTRLFCFARLACFSRLIFRCCHFCRTGHRCDLITSGCPFIRCKYHLVAMGACLCRLRRILPGKASVFGTSS